MTMSDDKEAIAYSKITYRKSGGVWETGKGFSHI